MLQCLIFILKWKAKLEFFLKESSNKKKVIILPRKIIPWKEKKEKIIIILPRKMILPRQRSYFAALLVSETNKQPPYLQSVCISTNYNASKLIKFQQIWQTNIVFVSWVTWLASLVPGPTILKRISFFRICKFLNNLIYKFVNGSLICVFRFEAMKFLFSIGFFI